MAGEEEEDDGEEDDMNVNTEQQAAMQSIRSYNAADPAIQQSQPQYADRADMVQSQGKQVLRQMKASQGGGSSSSTSVATANPPGISGSADFNVITIGAPGASQPQQAVGDASRFQPSVASTVRPSDYPDQPAGGSGSGMHTLHSLDSFVDGMPSVEEEPEQKDGANPYPDEDDFNVTTIPNLGGASAAPQMQSAGSYAPPEGAPVDENGIYEDLDETGVMSPISYAASGAPSAGEQ